MIKPLACGHCGGHGLFRDQRDVPPSWYCISCGWIAPTREPLPLLQSDRRADGTVRQKAREYGKYA